MSQKLENALRSLQQSVENFEKNFVANQNAAVSQPPQKSKQVDQNDLFSISSQQTQNQMAAVLDRTIDRMEKLVGENS